jgi:hypothetical protein
MQPTNATTATASVKADSGFIFEQKAVLQPAKRV